MVLCRDFKVPKKINSKIDPNEISLLAHYMRSFIDESQKIIDDIIKKFRYVDSYEDANAIATELFDFTTFSSKQADNIAEAFLYNDQVSDSWTSGPSCLSFFAKNWNLVKSEYQNKLEPYLKRK